MNNNILKGLALASVSALTLAGCAAAPAEPSAEPVDFKACMVSDQGGFDDGSFNEEAYNGLKKAIAVLGVQSAEAQSASDADFQPNVDAMVAEGCDLVVNVGFALGAATDKASAANPDVNFALVDEKLVNADFSYRPVDNVKPLLFDTAEAAFLAGYVAAATTQTGKVATFGGANYPSVTIFMDGFKQGVAYYNEAKGTSVEVLGAEGDDRSKWTMTGDFQDVAKGKTVSANFIKQGADIILPVAGPVGLGAGQAALDAEGVYVIGVDTDWYTNPKFDEFKSLILTSIQKNMSVAIFETIEEALNGNFAGGEALYVGTLENDGVGIAPEHDAAWSAGLADEVAALEAAIIAGDVEVTSEY
ncbi:BMP family ABC transporter substrate-binding protein [Rhodoluna sp. KAS3]|uniref:BMP family lipoprotein n=1 Tax=Rhodoluna sp. KAS3 TaxID=942880 RepID=UPI00222E25C1|nr:BMP family ABC transporter substrate-binding protein [Rhodoluna sp. KAS3]BDS48649.1 BMP family ABC transporter substrate-binding protein [Rhodoluna sp. KAS3]